MPELLPVVSRGIPPASVRVDRTGLISVEFEMAVGSIHFSRTAFVFEVVNDIRQRGPLEQIALHDKGKRPNRFGRRIASKSTVQKYQSLHFCTGPAALLQPIRPADPSRLLSKSTWKNCRRLCQNDRVFGPGWFVSQMVGEHFRFRAE